MARSALLSSFMGWCVAYGLFTPHGLAPPMTMCSSDANALEAPETDVYEL